MSLLRSEKLCSGPEIVKPELQRQREEAAAGIRVTHRLGRWRDPRMGQFGGGARIKALILVRLDLWGGTETCTRRWTAEGREETDSERERVGERKTDTDEDRLKITIHKRKRFPLRSGP